MHIFAVFTLLACVAGACKQPSPAPKPEPSQSAINKDKLCQDGGATFDRTTNSCVCPTTQYWDGNRCLSGSGASECNGSGGRWDEATRRCECPEDERLIEGRCERPASDDENEEKLCRDEGGTWEEDDCNCGTNKWWTGKRCRESDAEDFTWDRIAQNCEDAGGDWDRDERYCECADGKVLSDNECVMLTRGMTRSVCEEAVYPGSWLDGRCRCNDEDYVFSTSRGGCVPEQDDAAEDILTAICESSVNDGKWDSQQDRCDCPNGQIWFEEKCPEQSDLSSREVCESAYNDGVWNSEDKVCRCPVGTMWIDQSCRDLQEVTEQEACTSDFNGGRWDTTLSTCLCPNNQGWIASVKRCDDEGVSAAQQLCIQSGGRPQADTGGCSCPSGMTTRILQPQNYQYCVRDDSSDDVPIWLLILLGIMEG